MTQQGRFSLTVHARDVMTRRGIGMREVAWVLVDPENTWLGTGHAGDNRYSIQRGPLTVVMLFKNLVELNK